MLHIVTHINPEPWAVGKAYAARTKTGGIRGGISPNAKVQSYQKALQEALRADPLAEMHNPGIDGFCLRFWFWRQIEVVFKNGRRTVGSPADATNLQKSTEDALQGILIENDRYNRLVSSEIVEQGIHVTPTVAVEILPYSLPMNQYAMMNTETALEVRQEVLDRLAIEEGEDASKRNAW